MELVPLNTDPHAFAREELIRALNDCGISVPEDTKMSRSALSKRLGRTVDIMQRMDCSMPKLCVAELDIWNDSNTPAEAMYKLMPIRQLAPMGEDQALASQLSTLAHANACHDVRLTVFGVAAAVGEGYTLLHMADVENGCCGIDMKVPTLKTPSLHMLMGPPDRGNPRMEVLPLPFGAVQTRPFDQLHPLRIPGIFARARSNMLCRDTAACNQAAREALEDELKEAAAELTGLASRPLHDGG